MSSPSIVREILADPDRVALRDRLSNLIVRVRHGEHVLNAEEADMLCEAQWAEAERDPFDAGTYERLWELIPFAPPLRKLHDFAHVMTGQVKTKKKGAALLYLLRAYPEERPELFAKHDRDPDNEVQDSLARIEAAEDPDKAIARWERIIGTRRLSHEMAEMIPANIAYAIPSENLRAAREEYRQVAARAGGHTIWADVAAAISSRMQDEGLTA
jgi:hypothetical protein